MTHVIDFKEIVFLVVAELAINSDICRIWPL